MANHTGHIHGATSGNKFYISLVITLTFVAVEAIAGWQAHSLALLSDAAHNLSDALALGLAAFAIWIAQRPATAQRTFGYHRVAILTALFNAVTLVVLSAGIGWEAVQRFAHPEAITGNTMIWVALAAVFMNTVIAIALSGDAKTSLNSRAAFVHMLGDAISSAAVVVAGIVVHLTGWLYADPLVSLLIAAFIAYSAVDIVKEATDILLENTPKGLNVTELVAEIRRIAPILDVHDLHIWTVGDGLNFLSCHVVLPASTTLIECATVIEMVTARLHSTFEIGHATIQAEVEGISCNALASGALYCAMEPAAHDGCPSHVH